ncbi:MAG: hypothetical protein R3B54_18790 [Bdellovibrionota bacterium]
MADLKSYMAKARKWVLGLASVYLLYVIAGLVLLNGPFLRSKVNQGWNDGFIDYRWAWSPFPGSVEVHGFELRHEDHNVHWHLTMERLWTGVEFSDLLFSNLSFEEVIGTEVAFYFYEKRLRKSKRWAKYLPSVPPIPDRKPVTPPKHKKYPLPDKPWQVRVRGVKLRGFKELWFDQFRYEGKLNIGGEFVLAPQIRVGVGPVTLGAEAGTVYIGKREIASGISLDLSGKIIPFPADCVPGNRIFHFITAKSKLQAEGDLANALNIYLSGKWPMVAHSGEGQLRADAVVERGVFQEPSRVTFASNEMEFSLGAARITGKADFEWEVKEKLGRYSVEFADYKMANWRSKNVPPLLSGNHLHLSGSHLGVSLEKGFASGGRRALQLENAKLDLEALQGFLPKRTPVQFLGGDARLNVEIQGAMDGLDRGTLRLEAKRTQVQYKDSNMAGDVTLNTEILADSLPSGDFSLGNLKVRVSDFSVKQAKGTKSASWWAKVDVAAGEINLGKKPVVVLPASFSLKNAAPVLAVFGLDDKVPGFVKDALTEEGLRGEAIVKIDHDLFSVREAWIKNERLELRGRYQSATWSTRGVLLAKWEPFAVGLEVVGKETHLVLNNAIDWFRKYPPLSEPRVE